jgi:hypothetical protein
MDLFATAVSCRLVASFLPAPDVNALLLSCKGARANISEGGVWHPAAANAVTALLAAKHLKMEGNLTFKSADYKAAHGFYTVALRLLYLHSPGKEGRIMEFALLNNRAACALKLEHGGAAMRDAKRALNLGIYRAARKENAAGALKCVFRLLQGAEQCGDLAMARAAAMEARFLVQHLPPNSFMVREERRASKRLGLQCEDPELVSYLCGSIARGDIVEAERLLDAGMCVDDSDARGNFPLNLAVAHGRLDYLKVLIRRGAWVGARDGDGCPALVTAAKGARTTPYILHIMTSQRHTARL